jgi:hypothetical protein
MSGPKRIFEVRDVGPIMVGWAPVACDGCGARVATRRASPGGWMICDRDECTHAVRDEIVRRAREAANRAFSLDGERASR